MPDKPPRPFELIRNAPRPATDDDPEFTARQEILADRRLPVFRDLDDSAKNYYADDELLLAINTALHTGAPLLLTGEPGTGKTQAASFISDFFAIPLFKFFVKSTSIAQDLMYEFDAVGYLHWAQNPDKKPSADALERETAAVREGFLQHRALWQAYDHKGDCIVLIDEIDKAPRDFPNDLLHEFDQHQFAHPFDPDTFISRDKERPPPIIVVTSNDERRLPDAFLRRCIFHRIELTQTIVDAAVASMAGAKSSPFPNLREGVLDAARERFWELRERKPALEKRPSTAELLTWLSVLSARGVPATEVRDRRLGDLPALGVLIKNADDLETLRG